MAGRAARETVTLAGRAERARLARAIGDAEVMAGQLGYLLEATAFPGLSIGVIPFAVTGQPGTAFTVFDDARVYVELLSAQVTLTAPSEIVLYARALEKLSGLAVYGDEAIRRRCQAFRARSQKEPPAASAEPHRDGTSPVHRKARLPGQGRSEHAAGLRGTAGAAIARARAGWQGRYRAGPAGEGRATRCRRAPATAVPQMSTKIPYRPSGAAAGPNAAAASPAAMAKSRIEVVSRTAAPAGREAPRPRSWPVTAEPARNRTRPAATPRSPPGYGCPAHVASCISAGGAFLLPRIRTPMVSMAARLQRVCCGAARRARQSAVTAWSRSPAQQ
jgi:Domain of unknown function (DUF5753)